MKNCTTAIMLLTVFTACRRNFEAPVPDLSWSRFETGTPLPAEARNRLEGIYAFAKGADFFGADAALKWSYVAGAADTVFYLSAFCQKDASYFICEGKKQADSVLLNGYWRKMTGVETGTLRLSIAKTAGAAYLLGNQPLKPGDSIVIAGVYGKGNTTPSSPIQLNYIKKLYSQTPLEIVAHRGGGSTADLLPASENSLPMIRLASLFGATGIEIDVRMTSDGVPILYHDATLNERLIQKSGLVGPIENYSYAQLSTIVKLKKGETIPTLQQALETVITETPLRYVWLDTKFKGSLTLLHNIQKTFLNKAAAAGNPITITIGIPDEEVLHQFMQLPEYESIPSVCELTPAEVQQVNAAIWAPRWTLGLQNSAVSAVKAQGRKAFVWTLDGPENVKKYMYNGHFDGILTNYPSVVAYYYYVHP